MTSEKYMAMLEELVAEEGRATAEAALEEFMDGEDEVVRKDFIKYIGKDKRTIDKHVGDSELFELVSGPPITVAQLL